ncbi:Flp pilus assembly protein, ATPase CpaE [Candidatus Terasakiella magnetica]|nr:Flp pilus assembly protein, ATPase CpaE [Candidatus Terasakiella magnetica]
MIYRLTIDAFTSTAETAESLRQVQGDRALSKSRLMLHDGGLDGAIAQYAAAPTPQVVIIEDEAAATLVERLEHLAEVCEPGTKVLVIGGVNDIGLYRTLISKGVSDYLPRPVTPRQILDALAGAFSDPQSAPKARFIACWGARGGSGSSTLAQNLAWSLGRHLQEAVIYVDLDIAFGTSVLSYNLDAKQTVVDALAHPERLDEVLMDRCMVEYDEFLRVLASPGDCRNHSALAVDGLERMLDLAARMASVVVLDIPHLWADWTEYLLTMADEVVVTAIPDFASLRDAKSLMEVLGPRRTGLPVPRLVLNRVEAARKTQLTAKDFEDTIKLVPQMILPFEPGPFGEAANSGQMLGEVARGHKASLALAQFAVMLSGKAPAVRKPVSWLDRLRSRG